VFFAIGAKVKKDVKRKYEDKNKKKKKKRKFWKINNEEKK
jgi:hypothetical protein